MEWAPDNILSHNPTPGNVKDEKVGEGDARRVILEQAVEGISDVDFDPDRVEVCFLSLCNSYPVEQYIADHQLVLYLACSIHIFSLIFLKHGSLVILPIQSIYLLFVLFSSVAISFCQEPQL